MPSQNWVMTEIKAKFTGKRLNWMKGLEHEHKINKTKTKLMYVCEWAKITEWLKITVDLTLTEAS